MRSEKQGMNPFNIVFFTSHENSVENEISYGESEVDSAETTVENLELSSEQPDVILGDTPETEKSLQQKNKSTAEIQDLQESSLHEKMPNKSIHRDREHSKLNLSEDLRDLLESLHEKELNKSSSEAKEHSKLNLPEDLKDLLELIRDSGNRITQRELRKKSPYSESKVSLMLSDLEERGLIEKFKKGRGNIIRIPDVHIARQKKQEHKKE